MTPESQTHLWHHSDWITAVSDHCFDWTSVSLLTTVWSQRAHLTTEKIMLHIVIFLLYLEIFLSVLTLNFLIEIAFFFKFYFTAPACASEASDLESAEWGCFVLFCFCKEEKQQLFPMNTLESQLVQSSSCLATDRKRVWFFAGHT